MIYNVPGLTTKCDLHGRFPGGVWFQSAQSSRFLHTLVISRSVPLATHKHLVATGSALCVHPPVTGINIDNNN